jgi:sugar lactone lactonase YvrE
MRKKATILLVAMFVVSACRHAEPEVSTFAGSGTLGYADGNAATAMFSNPMGLAVDSAGNVFVADSRNNRIRKISANGMVTTLAGSGKVGAADGKGNAASFFFPTAIAVGEGGMVYVADTHNNLIRKVSSDGTVITIAGSLSAAPSAAKDTTIRFDNPSGIAVDKKGNVFVTDWAKDRILKIRPNGKVIILAGTGEPGAKDGAGTVASFYLPEGITVDANGVLYVADAYNNMVRKISTEAVVSTFIRGKAVPQQGRSRRDTSALSHPYGITVDETGNVYVADPGNNKIRKITPEGRMTTFAGSGLRGNGNGAANEASFYNPYGVAADSKGNIYVADYQNNLIRKISF